MERAVSRLVQALERNETIYVYGDYDVDGVTGSAQLLLFLRELGAAPGLYIPHRLKEGYGLNEGGVRTVAAQGGKVIITADCGAASHKEILLAQSLGIDVIICDHHQVPEVRPPALAVLNPLEKGCAFSFAGLSGAGVAFYLLMGLRMRLREKGVQPLPDLRRYLDLVTLGTVADMVPLVEDNRTLVTYGLKEIDRTKRPGMVALKEVSGLPYGRQRVGGASTNYIGFRLGPRLNAGGRLADAKRAVELLTTDDLSCARALAANLDQENRERQALEEKILSQALDMVRDMRDKRSVVLASDAWHPGVIGIVAARLVEEFFRPTILIALDGALGKGSGRSPYSFHLYQGVKACQEFLEGFGGHRQAAGLSIRAERVSQFREKFEQVVRERTREEDFIPTIDVDGELDLQDLTFTLLDEMRVLEPHGQGNPEPAFLAREVEVLSSRVVGGGSLSGKRGHLKLVLLPAGGGKSFEAIWFGMGGVEITRGSSVDVLYTPEVNMWNGMARIQLRLLDLRLKNV
jgi:single-stranded-DNA-specific exonuclease